MKNFTLIKERARRLLDISRDEYALLQYIQYRCADPRQSMPGWCDDDKELIAEHVEISRPGLYKMIDRMEEKNLLERSGKKGNLRVTQVFFDAENQQNEGQKTDDRVNSVDAENEKRVNSVDTPCKLSLHNRVNSVDTYNKVKKEYKKELERNSISDEKNFAAIPAEKEKEKALPGMIQIFETHHKQHFQKNGTWVGFSWSGKETKSLKEIARRIREKYKAKDQTRQYTESDVLAGFERFLKLAENDAWIIQNQFTPTKLNSSFNSIIQKNAAPTAAAPKRDKGAIPGHDALAEYMRQSLALIHGGQA